MDSSASPSKPNSFIKDSIKSIYYFLLNPFYKRIKAEILEEVNHKLHSIIETEINTALREVNQIRTHDIKLELQRINEKHLKLQENLSTHVAEQIISLGKEIRVLEKEIESVKSGTLEVKLNATLVEQLVKIHCSLEELKHNRHAN